MLMKKITVAALLGTVLSLNLAGVAEAAAKQETIPSGPYPTLDCHAPVPPKGCGGGYEVGGGREHVPQVPQPSRPSRPSRPAPEPGGPIKWSVEDRE
jgi:hypothetical protein